MDWGLWEKFRRTGRLKPLKTLIHYNSLGVASLPSLLQKGYALCKQTTWKEFGNLNVSDLLEWTIPSSWINPFTTLPPLTATSCGLELDSDDEPIFAGHWIDPFTLLPPLTACVLDFDDEPITSTHTCSDNNPIKFIAHTDYDCVAGYGMNYAPREQCRKRDRKRTRFIPHTDYVA